MPDGPPNCRTAEIAYTISEMHALSPKLARKRCSYIHILNINNILQMTYLVIFLTGAVSFVHREDKG